jgi:hypothetical protein
MPVKKLQVSVIIFCFGYIFLLFAGEASSNAYHDLGPSHIDSNLIALAQANHKNDTLPGNGIIFSLVPPKVLVQLYPSFAAETNHPALTLLTQFPPRAPPA